MERVSAEGLILPEIGVVGNTRLMLPAANSDEIVKPFMDWMEGNVPDATLRLWPRAERRLPESRRLRSPRASQPLPRGHARFRLPAGLAIQAPEALAAASLGEARLWILLKPQETMASGTLDKVSSGCTAASSQAA